MIRYIILITTLFALLPQLRGQDCIFNMYIRQGSQYYFSTYYQDYSKSKPLQDTCIQNMNGKPYRFYVFKDGIIQEEKLYYNPDNTLAIEFKRVKHDSVFAEMFSYDNQNRIRQHVSYYYDKGNHRCMKDELYHNGVLNQVRYFRSVHSKELAAAKLEPRPEHLIDSEGYTDFQVQIYEELNYYLTGEMKSRQHYQYVVTNNPNSGDSKTGAYTEYYENGKIKATAYYTQGANDKKHTYYYPDGSIREELYFERGMYTGIWKSYYPDGSLESTIDNDPKYGPNMGHVIRYYASGQIAYERKVEFYGKGYQVSYYENGNPKDWKRYEYGPSEVVEERSYYENGQLTHLSYLRPQNDTQTVVYFSNGNLCRINILRIDGEQDFREYYENGQLKTHQQVIKVDDATHQIRVTYYANGQIESKTIHDPDSRYVILNWPDGTLKSEKHYRNELLNGVWKEQDSKGHITKECNYKDGYRENKNCTFEMPKLPDVTLKEKHSLRVMINSYHACSFYNNRDTLMLTDKELEKQTEALARLYSYHKYCGKAWLLDSTVKSTNFTYIVMIPEGIYRKDQKKIDAVFAANGWNVKLKIDGGYASGNFKSSNYYNISWFDVKFSDIFEPNSGYITIQSTCTMIGLDMYSTDPVRIREIVRFKSGWNISIYWWGNHNQYSVYDSGEVELYNGIGTPIELLMTEQQYINIPKW